MRRDRRRRRLSMTSLIDVIFLLLLFFMLSSTFTRFAELELTAAAGSSASPAETPPLFLQLRAETLRLNGEVVVLEGLPDTLARLAAGEPRVLLVSLGDKVTSQRLTDLLVAVQSVGGVSATILGAS